jgi:predicted nucleic acid-binding protein
MSKNRFPIFDTNVFHSYKHRIVEYAEIQRFSSVVLYELAATTIDEETLARFNRLRETTKKDGRFLTPSDFDWWETAKAIRRLRFLRLTSKTTTPTELQNDALIARTAWRNDCFVITIDIDDFAYLQKVMSQLEVISAEDFFGE